MAHEISLFLQVSQYYSRYRKLLDIAFPDVKAMPSKLHPKSHPSVLGLPFTAALLSLCSRDHILPAVPTWQKAQQRSSSSLPHSWRNIPMWGFSVWVGCDGLMFLNMIQWNRDTAVWNTMNAVKLVGVLASLVMERFLGGRSLWPKEFYDTGPNVGQLLVYPKINKGLRMTWKLHFMPCLLFVIYDSLSWQSLACTLK